MLTLILLCAMCPPGLQGEVARILPEVPISWVSHLVETEGRTIQIRVEGNCWTPSEPREGRNLGWVPRVDGDILPFVEVDCGAIRALVSSQVFMPRAVAQVIVHELFHYLTGRTSHSAGLNSAKLGRRELEGIGTLSGEDRETLHRSLHLTKKEQ